MDFNVAAQLSIFSYFTPVELLELCVNLSPGNPATAPDPSVSNCEWTISLFLSFSVFFVAGYSDTLLLRHYPSRSL